MAFKLDYVVEVQWLPDGAGPMSQASAQKIVFRPQPAGAGVGETPISGAGGGWPVGPGPVGIIVPGGDAPTINNFIQALSGTSGATVPGGATGSLSGDVAAQIAAQLGRIQGFASGTG